MTATPAMTDVDDLQQAADAVTAQAHAACAAFMPPYQALRAAVDQVGQAWLGACLSDIGNLYHRELQPLQPPLVDVASAAQPQVQPRVPAALMASCRVWTQHDIHQAVLDLAGRPDMPALHQLSADAASRFVQARNALRDLLERLHAERRRDPGVAVLMVAVNQVTLADKHSIAVAWRQRHSRRHDLRNGARGAVRPGPFEATPAHVIELAALEALFSPLDCLAKLASLMRHAAESLDVVDSLDMLDALETGWTGAAALVSQQGARHV